MRSLQVNYLYYTDLNACFDPSCAELCKLSSYLLTTVSDLSNAAKTRLVELGLITSLLQALNIFKESSFNDVRSGYPHLE